MEKEINLQDIFALVWKKWWLVAISVVLCGVIFFVYSAYFIPEQFTSNGSLYVNSKAQETVSGEVNNTANLYELTTADLLVTTYKEILTSTKFFKLIEQKTDLPYPAEQLRKMVSYNSIEETCVINVSAVGMSPEEANELCTAVLDYANYAIMDIVEVGSVKTIDEASMPVSHSSPNNTLNTLIGMILGAVIACVIIFAIDYFDIRIKSAADIEEKFDLVIFGIIPNIESKNAEGGKQK